MIEPVCEVGALLDAVGHVRRDAARPLTNWFAAPERIRAWAAAQALSYVCAEDSVLIFRRDRDFYRLYHVSPDSRRLAAALAGLDRFAPGALLVSDLVGTPPPVDAIAAIHLEHGFRLHRSLVRMARDTAPGGADPSVEFAEPDDGAAVSAFLEALLDRFVDQVPDLEQVRDAIGERRILMLRRNGLPAAILWFETTGLSSLLRYWYVGDEFRGQGLGARLIRTFFELCRDGRRIVLWVIEDNCDAIAIYRRYGFRSEGLVDRIVVRNGRQA